jgi:uncharacterized protein with gpF-like domain
MSAQQFSAKIAELIAQSANLSIDARNKVIEMLDAVRKEIIVRLADGGRSTLDQAYARVLKTQIDQLFDKFRGQATTLVDSYEEKEFQLGEQMVSQPLSIFGISSSLGQLSVSQLAIAQGYTADLITNLSRESAAKINLTLQRAALGGQQITDIIAQIGNAISNGEFTGLFDSIGRRATSITLNELLRVNSIAAQARLLDASSRQADLQKQWRHLNIAMVPRPGHIAADGQVVDVDQPFTVEGEDLMYPRDPNGSAKNTINCHCMMAPYFAPDTLKPTAKQKGLLESLGISVTAA